MGQKFRALLRASTEFIPGPTRTVALLPIILTVPKPIMACIRQPHASCTAAARVAPTVSGEQYPLCRLFDRESSAVLRDHRGLKQVQSDNIQPPRALARCHCLPVCSGAAELPPAPAQPKSARRARPSAAVLHCLDGFPPNQFVCIAHPLARVATVLAQRRSREERRNLVLRFPEQTFSALRSSAKVYLYPANC